MRIIQMNAGGFIAFCMLLIGFVALPVVASGMQSTSAIHTAALPKPTEIYAKASLPLCAD